MILSHFFLALLWIIYGFLHSALAADPIKSRFNKRWPRQRKYYRLYYTLFAFLFLAAIILYQVWLPTIVLFLITNFLFIAGLLLSFTGLVIMLTCIFKYFGKLSGVKALYYEQKAPSLMITGIHRYVRHPLYLGTFAFLWGLFLILPYLSLLISNAIITLYTLTGMRLEERKLVNEFGKEYVDYQNEVYPLFPFFRPKRRRAGK